MESNAIIICQSGNGSSDMKVSNLTDGFVDRFGKMKAKVEEKIMESQNLSQSDLPDHFNSIKQDIQELQKFISESTKFLPSFNVKVALESIKSLLEKLEIEQDERLPKKRFAFRKSVNPSKPSKGKDVPDATKSTTFKAIDLDLYECAFRNLKNEEVHKVSSEISAKNVILSSCLDCVIHLYGYPSTLHASGLKNCSIYTGPVTTSVFVEECSDCKFFVACQQLRVHSTLNSDFYLHVTSRGIIEDSKGLRFSPYNWSYAELKSDFQKSGLSDHNNWQQIDDFNWLSKDAPSPNWSILDEDKRSGDGECLK